MLVDLPEGWATDESHPYVEFYREIDRWPAPDRLGRGLYLGLSSRDVDHLVENEHTFSPQFAGNTPEKRIAAVVAQFENDSPHDFGVCDTPEQVLERWPELDTDPRPFIITFWMVRREDQAADGGWRWHKHGIYIGDHKNLHEYLYDDTNVDVVYMFSVLQMKEGLESLLRGA